MSRLRCLVPFCRRTRAAGDFMEWVCAEHWRQVSRTLRRRYSRARRKMKRRPTLAQCKRIETLWNHCREQAIGRGFCV